MDAEAKLLIEIAKAISSLLPNEAESLNKAITEFGKDVNFEEEEDNAT